MVEPLVWYEIVAYTYWAIVVVIFAFLDFLELFRDKKIDYKPIGIFLLVILGFPGFCVALVFSLCLRLVVLIGLWLLKAFTDPDKFWSGFKLFEIKSKR